MNVKAFFALVLITVFCTQSACSYRSKSGVVSNTCADDSTCAATQIIQTDDEINSHDTDENGPDFILRSILSDPITPEKIELAKKFIASTDYKVSTHDTDEDGPDFILWSILADPITPEKIELAEKLIASGADINADDNDGCTLLSSTFIGADGCKLERLKILHKLGANADSQDTGGHTPLMQAIDIGDYECVKAILEMDPDVNELSYRAEIVTKSTALTHALDRDNAEITKLLIQSGAKVRESEFEHTSSSVETASQLLLEAGAPKEDVEEAVRYSQLDINDIESVKSYFKDHRLKPDFFIQRGPGGIDYKKVETIFIQAGIPENDVRIAIDNGSDASCAQAAEQGIEDDPDCM